MPNPIRDVGFTQLGSLSYGPLFFSIVIVPA